MLDTVSASFIRSLSTSLGLPCLGDRRRLRTAPSASTLTTDVFAELVSFPDLLSHPRFEVVDEADFVFLARRTGLTAGNIWELYTKVPK